jgi:citrate lyase subunit beta/citryl-CoA lyase
VSPASWRSLLFVPGDDERKLASAAQAGADAVVVDLEDGVAPERKDAARSLLASALPPRALVRVNGFESGLLETDLEAVRDVGVGGLVLPKASPEGAEMLASQGLPVVAIAETADGVRRAFEIACVPRVVALLLGAVDLGAQLGLAPLGAGDELLYARSKLVVDSVAAGIRPPFDSVHLTLDDRDGLEQACRRARALGLRGKACIHPEQVEVVNRAFGPDEQELAWARRVLAEHEGGVSRVAGEMVDRPVVERARSILGEAQ